MPFTGFDPYEPGGPIDASGGGLDPSAYYALSPGGRFPGDLANFLEYLASRGNGETANPDYKVPEWARNLPSWLGRLARGHEWNVQNNGPGTVADPLGGPAYNFWSGPGARYGPVGGPLHGLADQGTDRLLDGPDEPAVPRGNEGGRRGGGGGGSNGPKGLPTYGGLNFQPQFLDWQPNSTGATRFVPGSGSSFRPAAPNTKPKGGKTPRGVAVPPTSGGGGGRGGRLNPPPATSASPTANPSDPFFDWVQSLLGSGDLGRLGGQGPNLGASLRDGYTGIDVGNLGRGTPGWRRDPTTGVHDTSGMPLPTPRTPTAGESTASYMDYLHGLGFGVEDLFGMLGNRGFENDGSGNWSWRGWGAGPVVRGPNGYQFARQAVPRGEGGGGRDTTGLELDSVWRQALLR